VSNREVPRRLTGRIDENDVAEDTGLRGSHEVAGLRRALAPHVRGDTLSTPDCLDDGTVAALVDGTLDAASRAAVLPHLAGCRHCRSRVASLTRALADPTVAREAHALEDGRQRRVLRIAQIAGGVAAAAVLVLLAWPAQIEEPSPHRAPPITAAPAPEAVSPVGTVADAPSLGWTAVPGADLYRVTLFDAQGTVLYEADLADTVAILPASLLPARGETYWWQVEARLGFDRWAASELIEFSVAPGTRP
jgi:hypothetical protein